ncbi:MAG: carbohydrate kinase [Kiloniellaceae bacterium]
MFLICGEALFDVFPVAETETGVSLDARIGGSPFNVALGLSRLGRRVGFFTGLSSDPLGRRLEKALRDEGVDTGYLVRKANPTTLAVVGLSESGQPQYTFYGHEAADRVVTTADLPRLGGEVSGLHFGSYSLVVGDSAEAFLTLARSHAADLLVSLDPNVRLNVEPDVSVWQRRVEAYSEIADLIKVSDEDLDLLYPGEAASAAVARWHARGVRLVVVTRGGEGATVSLAGETFDVPGRSVEIVDTVGAGDTFQAALLCGLEEMGKAAKADFATLEATDCRRLVDFAAAAAAVTCTRRGADLPRRDELPGL